MNNEIEEIEKEVNANYYYYTDSVEEKKRTRTLLSYIHVLEENMGRLERSYRDQLRTNGDLLERAKEYRDYISRLSARVKELEHSLFELNGKYSARAKELYETEQERERLSKELIKERMKVVGLWDAIDRHEAFKRTHEKVVPLEDEELYRTRKEII